MLRWEFILFILFICVAILIVISGYYVSLAPLKQQREVQSQLATLQVQLAEQREQLEPLLRARTQLEQLQAQLAEQRAQLEELRAPLERVGRQARLDELQALLRAFPWPPPLASATELIPRKLLQEKSKPMQLIGVDHKLTKAIKQNGYYESSYYTVPEGFALATRMEQIEPDGTPKKEPLRWNLKDQTVAEFSLAAYLKALLFASPGYYRVIVFIVTPVPLTQSSSGPSLSEAIEWLSSGYNRLPDAIGNLKFSPAYTCTALIYEFERTSESEEPHFRQPGRIPGHTHLVKAGIWASLQP